MSLIATLAAAAWFAAGYFKSDVCRNLLRSTPFVTAMSGHFGGSAILIAGSTTVYQSAMRAWSVGLSDKGALAWHVGTALVGAFSMSDVGRGVCRLLQYKVQECFEE